MSLSDLDFLPVEDEQPHKFTEFCGTKFWDVGSAWESELPDVGLCVERTILLWVPCFFLWILTPFYIVYLRRKGQLYMPWTPLTIIKIISSCALILTATTELIWTIILSSNGESPPTNEYFAPILLLITYLVHTLLVIIGRRHGERNSPLIYVFWLLMVVFGLPQLFTTVQYTIKQDDRLHTLMATTFLIQYVGAITLFAVNCIAEKPPPSSFQKYKLPTPFRTASYASKLTFHWANKLLWKGYRNTITPEDIWDLQSYMSSSHLDNEWEKEWANEEAKSKKKTCKQDENTPTRVSTFSVLMRRFLGGALISSVLYLLSETMIFASPRLLGFIIQFTTDLSEPMWHGYLYAILLFLTMLFNTITKNMFFYIAQLLGAKIKSTIMIAVYRKALILSNTSRRKSTLGEIVNLMAIDSQRVGDAIVYVMVAAIGPVIIIIALSELWRILGPSALAGFLVLALLIPVNSIIANKIKGLQVEHMKLKDRRIKMVTEIINGIKVLKLYAWEKSFTDQVDAIRNTEIKVMRKIAYLQATANLLISTTPYLMALSSFATFVLISEENVLTSQNAFMSLALVNIINFPIIMLPITVAQCIQAHVSLKRLDEYLNSSNIDMNAVTRGPEENSSVVIENGRFNWGKIEDEQPWTLKDINFSVAPKSLIAVVGSVGAGKSSLVSALLGEMQKEEGKAIVNGNVAYVSQQAWLQNASIKENITWGSSFDAELYRKVIDACALQPDLDMLPGGDMTEVGEKGLNLSGGQKQRIALARATYNNSNIIILDDPLSAVDSHVGRHIFQNLIGPKGLLKDKTRILVTHAIWVLPQMDEIFVVRDGSLVERGTYDQLLSEGGNFSQFLLQHINNKIEDEEEESEELSELCGQLDETSIGQALLRQISRRGSQIDDEKSSIKRQRTISTTSSHKSSDRDTNSSPVKTPTKSISMINGNKTQDKKEAHVLVEKEKSETGKVKLTVYKFYGASAGVFQAIIPFVFLFVAQVCKAGSNVWLSQYSTKMEESANETSQEFDRTGFLSGYGGFGIGQCFFFFLGTLAMWAAALLASKHIHGDLLKNIVRLPMSFFDTNPSGRIMNRMSKEIDVLDSVLPYFLSGFGSCLAQVVITIIVIITSTPMVAIPILPLLVMYYFVQSVYITSARQIKRIESVAKSPVFSHFSETLQGVSIIRAFKKQLDFIVECRKKIDESMKAFVANLASNRWLLVRLESLGNLITFSAAIFTVAARGSIDPGIVGLSITYALEVTFILNAMVRNASEVEANIVSVERIQEYIDTEQEASWTVTNNKPSKLWPENGVITFKKYKARYRPGLELVVKGITCKINHGEKVGIVGRTGAGKSSLTLALFRIIEAAGGEIEIDGINISKIGLHDLRAKLSIIPQDPVLFSGSLRVNVDPFNKYTDEEVWNALENAHLKAYIQEQTNGLQTTIDEGGANLSVGQRQLVCLARALLKKTRILVLDEATAAVDLDTDDLIQKTIRTEFADCTILTIAHRLNNIMDSDRVMVLDSGLIAEFCSPAELLSNKDSIFYGMAVDAGLT